MKKINSWLSIIVWASMLFGALLMAPYIDDLLWDYGTWTILGVLVYFVLFIVETAHLFKEEA